MKILFNILIIILFSFAFSENDDKLIFVVTHFRHGSRAPQSINDNYLYLLTFLRVKGKVDKS